MLTSHELFGFMSPALGARIIEFAHDENKELYRAASCVAECKKVRPLFWNAPAREPHADMAVMLSRPRLELVAANLLREWLMKKQTAMLVGFLDALGISHKDAVWICGTVEDAKLTAAVDGLLANIRLRKLPFILTLLHHE